MYEVKYLLNGILKVAHISINDQQTVFEVMTNMVPSRDYTIISINKIN